jgi:preprotein translocase subunit SecG
VVGDDYYIEASLESIISNISMSASPIRIGGMNVEVDDELFHRLLTNSGDSRYNRAVSINFKKQGNSMSNYLDVALIITSIALVVSVILQSKGAGLGGLAGGDSGGGVVTTRRGIEKILFFVTIGLSVLFFVLTILTVIVSQPAVVAG